MNETYVRLICDICHEEKDCNPHYIGGETWMVCPDCEAEAIGDI